MPVAVTAFDTIIFKDIVLKFLILIICRNLTEEYKKSIGITMMDGWEDPFGKRSVCYTIKVY